MSIPESLKERVFAAAKQRCGYCRMPAELIYGFINVDHIYPKALGGTDDEQNLWVACSLCNTYKADNAEGIDPITHQKLELFNPRTQVWSEHFEHSADQAVILGKSPCGRATIATLQINRPKSILFRQMMVSLGKYPSTE
jgi:hypothetical protein